MRPLLHNKQPQCSTGRLIVAHPILKYVPYLIFNILTTSKLGKL